jgi:hypoxanthine phosphoribosyltransferase
MEKVKILDLEFSSFLTKETLESRIAELAEAIDSDYQGSTVVFVAVLNGSFIFTSELVKRCRVDCEVNFIRVKSYENTTSTGKVTEIMGLESDLRGKHIIVLEDIVDTGLTLDTLLRKFAEEKPASIQIASLLMKPDKLQFPGLPLKYIGFEIPNDFVVGYGLDYNGLGRNLPCIYTLIMEKEG